jgi:hypothetical protein
MCHKFKKIKFLKIDNYDYDFTLLNKRNLLCKYSHLTVFSSIRLKFSTLTSIDTNQSNTLNPQILYKKSYLNGNKFTRNKPF